MSAYVVSPTHIDALLSIALHGPTDGRSRYGGDEWRAMYVYDGGWPTGKKLGDGVDAPAVANETGARLLAECIESVAYRYDDTDRSDLPGPVPTPDPEQYEFTDLGCVFTLAEAFMAIDGYEYQACEHPGWRESEAFRFCADLRSHLVSKMGLPDASTWEVTAEKAIERMRPTESAITRIARRR